MPGSGVIERALIGLADHGAVIVIELALRETARGLHELRDAILARGGHIFAPCTRRLAPCTALIDPADWCHQDRAVTLPRRTAELARLTHLRDGGLKFAYLVVRKHPSSTSSIVSTARPRGAWSARRCRRRASSR